MLNGEENGGGPFGIHPDIAILIFVIKALGCIFQQIANIVRDLVGLEKGNGVHISAYCLEVGLLAAIP